MTPENVESLLRKAPRPPAPTGLREELLQNIDVRPGATSEPVWNGPRSAGWPWWRRWWPALSYAVVMLAGLAVLAVQTRQLAELRRENAQLRATLAAHPATKEGAADYQRLAGVAREVETLRKNTLDLPRLREETEQLRASVADLPAVRTRHQQLQAQARATTQAEEEEDVMAAAKAKARSIACINNLKQLCLAARIYANDHKDVLPPDFVSMAQEMHSPKILVCPADTGKHALEVKSPSDWQQLGPNQVSYDFLAPGISETNSPQVVVFRCPIHGHIGLLDGSAQQMKSPEAGADQLVQSNGLYYLTRPRGQR